MRDGAVFVISVAAELAGVHPQTLRGYERKGLLKPARTAGGTRRYSQRDVDRVRLIQDLTQGQGVNLAGVLRIIALQDELERVAEELDAARADLDRVRAEARQALAEVVRSSGRELVLYRRGEIERHPTSRR